MQKPNKTFFEDIEKGLYKELALFPGRTEALSKITRYSLYQVMFYRTDLLTHSRRVCWIMQELIREIAPFLTTEINHEKALLLALIHDDAEIVMGDIQAGNKSKMSLEQLKEVEDAERNAIKNLAEQFPPTILGFTYIDLLTEITEKRSFESQLLQFADKADAFGEALHEIFGGNYVFAQRVTNEYGEIPTPLEYYIDYFSQYSKKFPETGNLLAETQTGSMMYNSELKDFYTIAVTKTPHTPESLQNMADYPQYEWWKNVIMNAGGREESLKLTTQKEYIDIP